jgi:hypothetical protein
MESQSWVLLWRYAVAFGVATRKLQADLEASAIPVAIVAGEPIVRPSDIEQFLEARQAAAQAFAEARAESNMPPVLPLPATRLQKPMAAQALAIEELHARLNAMGVRA